MKFRLSVLLTALALLALTTTATQADTILLDLGFNTVVSGQPYGAQTAQDGNGVWWNTTMWDDTTRPFDRTDVLDITGSATTVDVTALTGVYGSGGQNTGVSAASGLGILAQDGAINDYISSSSSFSFKLGGLTDGTEYTITLLGSRASGTRSTNYAVTGSGAAMLDEQQVGLNDTSTGNVTVANGTDNSNAGDYIDLSVFTVTPDVNGEITIAVSEGAGSYAYLNIVQLDYAVPEPSSLGLAALGSLFVLARGRRRRS